MATLIGATAGMRYVRTAVIGAACCSSPIQLVTEASAQVAAATVVEHQTLQPPGLPRWSIGDTPTLTLGVAQGPPYAQEFSKIVAVMERSDGVIVIADADGNELRAFSAAGEHLWTAGGTGGGPGEFSNRIQLLSRFPGDSLLATEDGRATIFAPGGRVGRTTFPIRP